MPFNRPPRILTPLPDDDVEIPDPPNPPNPPGPSNLLTSAIPLLLAIVVIVLIASTGGSGSVRGYAMFLPMMAGGTIGSAALHLFGKRRYRRELAEAQLEYTRALGSVEARLQSLHRRGREILHDRDPGPVDCIRRAQGADPRLGERRIGDADFLHVRLGLGSLPTTLTIKAPELKTPIQGFEQQLEYAAYLAETFASIPEVPVRSRMADTGSVGIAGERGTVLGFTRAFIGHLVTHHWPSEVQVAAIGGARVVDDWRWMHPLPHGTSLIGWRQVLGGDAEIPPAGLMTALETELQRREQWLETQKQAHAGNAQSVPLSPRLVLLFDSLPTVYSHPGLSLMLEKGKALGVIGIFLAERPQLIPGACGAVIHVKSDQTLSYQEAGPDGIRLECRPDVLDRDHAAALARALASIAWPETDDISQPPPLITFLEMYGCSNVDDLPVEAWWGGDQPFGFLMAPIGKTSATADLIFDLKDHDGSHGPHGLIGGMTGSGKSEVLKTILLSLATVHNPYDLNFALIDYKGGAAFNELAKLPHTVGVITDIESHATYSERVILALTGEIERRKRILESARSAFGFGRSHVDEYRKLPVKRPLPHLVIVFDEFAEFKQRHPAESKRLISIARQGRSLGVHLVLATQNIEAAVDPEILQNSKFRICLRVSEMSDSIQMVGIPDAVHLTRGRAYLRADNRMLFQAGFAGALYNPRVGGQADLEGLVRIWPDGRREVIQLSEGGNGLGDYDGQAEVTEAQAVVDRLVRAAQNLKLEQPPAVWPAPLPARLYLPDLLADHMRGGWDGKGWAPAVPLSGVSGRVAVTHPILGLYDHPAVQKQFLLQDDPDQGGGNLLVFGSSGTGKSTLLRTLVTSLAWTNRPDEVHVYILDFGGQSTLKVLETMPHVGAVVTRFETERVERLVQFLNAEMARRNDSFRKAKVDNLEDYNAKRLPENRLPRIVAILDNFLDFKRGFPIELVNSFTGLLGGGVSAGIYLVVAASLQSDVPNDLFANINMRLTFYQADQTEYFRLVGQPSEAKLQEDMSKPPPPGRGLIRKTSPLEFQTALPVQGGTDQEQAERLAELAEAMNRAWEGRRPTPIYSLPLLVTLPETDQMPKPTRGSPALPLTTMLGLDYETLAPVGLSLEADGPSFLVAGVSPQSGKTTLLQTWVLGLAEGFAPDEAQLLIVDFHARTFSAFRKLPHTRAYVGSKAELADVLGNLHERIAQRKEALEKAYEADPDGFNREAILHRWEHIFVVIDDYDAFAVQIDDERGQLAECLMGGGEVGVSFAISGNISELPRDFDDPFMQRTRRHGCGVLLGGVEGIDQFNNARRPPGQPGAGLPPGRGYMIKRGQVRLFQAAVHWQEGEFSEEALGRRVQRIVMERMSSPASP